MDELYYDRIDLYIEIALNLGVKDDKTSNDIYNKATAWARQQGFKNLIRLEEKLWWRKENL